MRIAVFLSLVLGLAACGGEEEECFDPGWEGFAAYEADGSPVCMPDPSEGLRRCMTSGRWVNLSGETTLGYYPERDCTEILNIEPEGDTYRIDWGCIVGNHVSDKCDDWRPVLDQ